MALRASGARSAASDSAATAALPATFSFLFSLSGTCSLFLAEGAGGNNLILKFRRVV